jgi:hypothetical protein
MHWFSADICSRKAGLWAVWAKRPITTARSSPPAPTSSTLDLCCSNRGGDDLAVVMKSYPFYSSPYRPPASGENETWPGPLNEHGTMSYHHHPPPILHEDRALIFASRMSHGIDRCWNPGERYCWRPSAAVARRCPASMDHELPHTLSGTHYLLSATHVLHKI